MSKEDLILIGGFALIFVVIVGVFTFLLMLPNPIYVGAKIVGSGKVMLVSNAKMVLPNGTSGNILIVECDITRVEELIKSMVFVRDGVEIHPRDVKVVMDKDLGNYDVVFEVE